MRNLLAILAMVLVLADETDKVINRDVFTRIVVTSDSTRLKVFDIALIMLAVEILVALMALIKDLIILLVVTELYVRLK